MSAFEPRGNYQTVHACALCRWCDPTTVYASNPPKYYCSKFNTYVYCDQTTCQADLEDGQFIGANGHKYHVETKHGKDWSNYSLIDDTVREWQNLSKKAEEKKKEERKPEERIDVVRDYSPKEEAEQKKEEPKPIDYSRHCKTAIFDPGKPTSEERLEALEKKVEDLEKRLRNY